MPGQQRCERDRLVEHGSLFFQPVLVDSIGGYVLQQLFVLTIVTTVRFDVWFCTFTRYVPSS